MRVTNRDRITLWGLTSWSCPHNQLLSFSYDESLRIGYEILFFKPSNYFFLGYFYFEFHFSKYVSSLNYFKYSYILLLYCIIPVGYFWIRYKNVLKLPVSVLYVPIWWFLPPIKGCLVWSKPRRVMLTSKIHDDMLFYVFLFMKF